jgi:threonine dehydrogenase-like Zn-dependent dehydrogenase
MKAAVVVEPGHLELLEVPDPRPGPYQVLVRTLAGGLCGTDRHIVAGTFYRKDYPTILGHEAIGEVVELGPGVRSFRVGDRILRTAAARPGERLGAFASTLGGFAEWAIANDVESLVRDRPEASIKPYDRMQKAVPAAFDPIDAGAFIVLKETYSWLRRLADPGGRRVLIVGTGPAALSFVQLARLQEAAQIIVLGRRQKRLDLARRLGADTALVSTPVELAAQLRELTDGRGVDLAIEAAGATDVLEAIPDGLATRGVLGVYGVSAEQAATIRWGWGRTVPRTWSLRFEEPDEAGIHDEAWELVRAGRYQLKATLTHVLPLERVSEALDTMGQEEACKVAIDFRDTALVR